MNRERMTAPYALEASGLSVVLGGHKVLEIPSLWLLPNEVLAVIGPNGAGKTTLLLCLALLLKPTIRSWHARNFYSRTRRPWRKSAAVRSATPREGRFTMSVMP